MAKGQVYYIISIHALLAESDIMLPVLRCLKWISIHALLAESDGGLDAAQAMLVHISIHALLAESDTIQAATH